jgi:hypothetical protein
MTKNTVSIALSGESLTRFSRLLGNRSLATGVHCGDDDDGVDGVHGGTAALGAHCGDDDGDVDG